MTNPTEDLRNALIKIFVDKLLIGIILAILGFFASNLIEDRKSDRAFIDELNKIKAQKVGEVWEKVSLFDAAIEEVSGKLLSKSVQRDINNRTVIQDGKREKELRSDFSLLKNRLQSKYVETLEVLNKHRFWLGEDGHNRVHQFLEVDKKYLEDRINFLAGVPPKSGETEKLILTRNEARMSINRMRNEFLGER